MKKKLYAKNIDDDKAKRYDDLLVKLQEAKVNNDVCDERYCCVIDDIVPEHKEKDVIPLLEKQGEQKPADTWKPSEEQIKELEFFISELPKCSVTAQKIVKKGKDTLVSLLSDLKKLKEE